MKNKPLGFKIAIIAAGLFVGIMALIGLMGLKYKNIASNAEIAAMKNVTLALESEVILYEMNRDIDESRYNSDMSKSKLIVKEGDSLFEAMKIHKDYDGAVDSSGYDIYPIQSSETYYFNGEKAGTLYELENYYVITEEWRKAP